MVGKLFKDNYIIDDNFIIRLPLLPITYEEITTENVDEILQSYPQIEKALRHASPEFLKLFFKGERNEKVMGTFVKYLNRMTYRSTPFGLMAGIAKGRWQGDSHRAVINSEKWEVLNTNLEKTSPSEKYFSNPTLFSNAEGLNYYKTLVDTQNNSKHVFSQVEHNEVLEELVQIANNGCAFEDLLEVLLKKGFEEKESTGFIQELIEEQLLVVATNYSNYVPFSKQAITAHSILAVPDKEIQTNSVLVYPEELSLNQSISSSLYNVMDVFNKLTAVPKNSAFEQFVKEFTQRYGEKVVPLLEVMHPVTGISYGQETKGMPQEDSLDSLQRFLMQKVNRCLYEGLEQIEINENELTEFEADWSNFPSTFSCLFSIVDKHDATEPSYYLNGAGSTNAINLFARFSPFSQEVNHLCQQYIEYEANDDIEFCSVDNYEKEDLQGVVLNAFHPKKTTSFTRLKTVDKSQFIALNNLRLMYNYKEERLELYSLTSGKRVVPRFYSSYFPQDFSHPVIHLLFDMQLDIRKKNFCKLALGDWQYNYPYIPRISYNKFIFKPAQWILNEQQVNELRTCSTLNKITSFLTVNRLPDKVILVKGDQELFIDFKRNYHFLTSLFTKDKKAVLQEVLFSAKEAILQDEDGKSFANEFVALFKPKHKLQTLTSEQVINFKQSEENSWISIHWYANEKSHNKLLLNDLKRLVRQLENKIQLEQFFFVRYKDDNDHLRIRFKVSDANNYSKCLVLLNMFTNELIQQGTLWDFSIGRYLPEIRRYSDIHKAEQLFSLDSRAFLNLKMNYDKNEVELYAQAISILKTYFNLFEFTLDEKIDFSAHAISAYEEEFQLSKAEKRNLGIFYRKIESLELDFEPYFMLPSPLNQQAKRDYQFISSVIHMSLNRFFPNHQRKSEYFAYQFYWRAVRKRRAVGRKL